MLMPLIGEQNHDSFLNVYILSKRKLKRNKFLQKRHLIEQVMHLNDLSITP